ncbi:enoyl-CoA hydratase/isomerase family protein [Crenothrix sp.]|uniref:enoyl-CoA hydratase/isomerase family protein n=1 Tax=Crenothrix sp. TaxID=3100433 RepID=UPI00374C8F09
MPTTSILKNLFSKPIKTIKIDYKRPGQQLPCQEIWYELEGEAAYVYFACHNGGMSTEQCHLLLWVYQHVATLPVKAIVLMGGEACFSNGIHLNHIEVAGSPADESWLNIMAIDDIVYQIINTVDKVTVAAIAGSAGAGGAMMPLAADKVFAREGVIFNPHYKNMGELYGSEYWTYLLPKRVGQEMAHTLTEQRLPISAKKAWQINLIDKVLDKRSEIFSSQVKQWVNALITDAEALQKCLIEKSKARCNDEATKALATYRKCELTKMYENFYGDDRYHKARQQFVYKICDDKTTPENIALHRQKLTGARKISEASVTEMVR